MPRLTAEEKKQIKSLEIKELQNIVTKIASKEKVVYDYLKINYLDKDSGEEELFQSTKEELEDISWKNFKGRSAQLRNAKSLAASIKRINEFTKVSSNKVMEADLLIYVLKIHYTDELLGTCFTQFDSKVASIVKRLLNVVTKKLHEDYRIEYADTINHYLAILHKNSNHLDTVFNMPDSI